MAGGLSESFKDLYPLVSGTYSGPVGLTIYSPGKDFKSCGVTPGLAVRNLTDGSTGAVVTVSEDQITITLADGTLNVMTAGDEYEIYKTTTYGSTISTHYVDRRYGHKYVNPDDLENGIPVKELDVDEYDSQVFGPGQPYDDRGRR